MVVSDFQSEHMSTLSCDVCVSGPSSPCVPAMVLPTHAPPTTWVALARGPDSPDPVVGSEVGGDAA